jgi:lipopolysaccharide transport system ATP-binding protein
MSGLPVVKAENISKKYCKTLKRSMFYGLSDICRNVLGLKTNSGNLRINEFWAVDGVSFEIKPGEIFGVIGANGAGKTALLKMLNGIFWPDKGKITVNGKVGALIEVGAGFHPALTGRENIYINGAILGMSKKEVEDRFDNIVAFAELGSFLDAPVKHYSSGMYVKLGFAIAVYSKSDILLVDEILSVGDEKFRNKCQNRIEELRKAGTAIIYVSHDLMSVKRLCSRGLWLDAGKARYVGDIKEAVDSYIFDLNQKMNNELSEANRNMNITRAGSGEILIKEVRFEGNNREKYVFRTGEDITIDVLCNAKENIKKPLFGAIIHGISGTYIAGVNSSLDAGLENISGPFSVRYTFLCVPLLPGRYFLSLVVHDEEGRKIYDHHDQAYEFQIALSSEEILPVYSGFLQLKCKWEYKRDI